MKRIIWLTLCLCLTVGAVAQKQTVIVRTIERPHQKSTTIKGATVKINGYPNALVSGKGGKFTFAIQGKKQGEKCFVTSVTKKDYTLVDKLPVFAYSYSTPAEIVMASNKQLQQEEKRIRDKGKKEAEARYNKRIAELEKQLEEKTISEESYREQLQQVFDGHENFLKLIDEMARRYAMTDYKGISDINRQIQECIENSEFERADSLINSKGDINQRNQDLQNKKETTQKLAELHKQAQEDYETSLNDLAQDHYNKHLICAANYQNDSAAYWLEQRAALDDTTNVEWLNDAGLFINRNLANYDLALEYFLKGLALALAQYGENNEHVVVLYNNIGRLYDDKEDYKQALENLFNSLNLSKSVLGDEHSFTASIFNNIGLVYDKQGKFDQAFEYLFKANNIWEKVHGHDHINVATSYNNIGLVYTHQLNVDSALRYFTKSLDIFERILGLENTHTAIIYDNLGLIYNSKGDYEQSIVFHQKALDIRERVLGTNHPDVAASYNNIGLVYNSKQEYRNALECYNKALLICKRFFSEENAKTAQIYNNIGVSYYYVGNYVSAIEYLEKALSIRERLLEANNPIITESYINISYIYRKNGEFSKALGYLYKALSIYEQVHGTENIAVAYVYNHISGIYDDMKDYTNALEYCKKALDIRERERGTAHPEVATSYNNLGEIYRKQGDYPQAMECYMKALSIFEVNGTEDSNVAMTYNNIGLIYDSEGDYGQALEFHKKSLAIRERILGREHDVTAMSYFNIGMVYNELKDYNLALEYIQKTLNIFENIEQNQGIKHPQKQFVKTIFDNCQYQLGLETGKLNDFYQEHCFIETIVDGDTPAHQQGMSGEYILLEIDDWNEKSPRSIYDKNKELSGKPKDIVVLKDGVIAKHHFDNMIGAKLGIKEITKEERKQINQLYEKWKKEQNN